MASVQTRIFRRVVSSSNASSIENAITEIEDEINSFTAPFPIGHILDIKFTPRTVIVKLDINSWFVLTAVVIYLQP